MWILRLSISVALSTTFVTSALVDLTKQNRREPLPDLPDWSGAGFEGGNSLPDDSKGSLASSQKIPVLAHTPPFLIVAFTLTPAVLASQQDDTAGLQQAITAMSSQSVPDGTYRLIQLPAGTINLSYMIYVDTSYLIIRGTGQNPNAGGTKIIFRPDADTKYDKTINERWDLDSTVYDWDFQDESGKRVFGSASGGWLWPGRSIFRVGSSKVAAKYTRQHAEAPKNRKDLFKGSVNYHWRSDEGKTKGWMVSQAKDKAGVVGTSLVRLNATATSWVTTEDNTATDWWIASPAKRNDFVSWGVETQNWFVNSYIYQDWFTVTKRGVDGVGPYLELDRPLRFDVYRSSTGDGSSAMEDSETFAKAMPIAHVNLYITQEIDGLTPESATRNYGNLAPEQAMHGIVFRFARDSWVRNIQTFMTGSHPIATEAARNIQIQDNYFDGAWNKGKGSYPSTPCFKLVSCLSTPSIGGNGYLRGSRVWDSLYYNNTLRNLRHITMQWCAMGNVVILNNMTFTEVGRVSIYSSSTMYLSHTLTGPDLVQAVVVRVEIKNLEPGIRFGGVLARKRVNGAAPLGQGTNIFYRNYMIKQQVDGGEYVEYRPYFARDGSLSSKIWQLGWDSQSPAGIRYTHLSTENRVPIKDWQSHELVDFSQSPAYGANSFMEDPHTSLFLKDVSAAAGTIATYSGVAGNSYCRGDVAPQAVGYYFASASRRPCNPFFPNAIDYTVFTHIVFAYGVAARDGTITVASEDQQLLRDVAALKSEDPSLKVILAVGGWGLGSDPANMVAIAASSAARTKLGTSGASICQSYGLDGIDIEWAPGISATQWKNIIQAAANGLKASNFNLTMSTPHSFWSSSGINTVAADLSKAVDFMSLISHDISGTTLEYANSLSKMSSAVMAIHKLGFPRSQIMMGVPFYGRSRKLSDPNCDDDGCGLVSGLGSTSTCISTTGVGQGTFPYFVISDRLNGGSLDQESDGQSYQMDNSAARYATSSGYVFDYETPASVVEKARVATLLCLGGLSIFALDQDNRKFELTTAIWGAGALVPTAAEIVSTISGEPLTAEGLVSADFWDGAADQILANYPSLSMELNYQVMLLLAIKALDTVASSLYEYLKFSALSEDSFNLYKKWESKALDWAIANETGKGNDFWECSYQQDSSFAHDTCPGGHNTRGADVDDVYWRLTDAGGFSNYLSEALGIDTSMLVVGEIPVGRNPSKCGAFPLRRELPSNVTNTTLSLKYDDAIPETNETIIANSELFEDDGTGRVRRIQLGNSSIEARHHVASMPPYDPAENSKGFSPYDPDKDCFTAWHNVLVIDADTFFPNVKDGIQAYLDQYESFKVAAVKQAASPFETVESVASSLHLALTTLVSGNDTLYSTMQYIEQVKYDKTLQEQYDELEEQARQAGIQLIIDIVLTLLSFVPFGGLVSAAARAARALVPVFRSARATRSLARGLEKALDGAMDARNLRSVDDLLSPTALEGRGRIGKALDRVQEFAFECDDADYVGLMLDMLSLAEPVLPTVPLLRRNYTSDNGTSGEGSWFTPINGSAVSPSTAFDSENPVRNYLHPRGKTDVAPKCIWKSGFGADNFKVDTVDGYKARCHDNSDDYPMKWVDEANNKEVKTLKYTDCRPPNGNNRKTVDPVYQKGASIRQQKGLPNDPGDCQCDHMFEADELRSALRRNNPFDDAQAEIICAQPEYAVFLQKVLDKMNGIDNMRPLFQGPNGMKSNFIRSDMLAKDNAADKSWKKYQQSSANDASVGNKNMQIMDEYMKSIAGSREQTAKDLDVLLKGLTFADPKAANLFKKFDVADREVDVDGQKKKMGLVEADNHHNTKLYARKLELSNFKSKLAVDNTKAATDAAKVAPRRSARLNTNDPAKCSKPKQSNKKLGLGKK
ncbi:unnamed protein product [Rhizoctonia solani]|uniref:GH18 domain-containing protein n=1 Tax=Rhizoctonia solani TaxID=456999 RepID=A0A8H2XW93_9AGAM|nr:unnamed protein product [Rhizoctonia solani]